MADRDHLHLRGRGIGRYHRFLSPLVAAVVFVLVLSLVREPARQRFNAIFVAGAGDAYLGGALGGWELAFTAVETGCA